MDLKHVALIAFVIGVLFHACVVYAVLDDGSTGSDPAAPRVAPVTQQATPTPVSPVDRSSCAEIRGTDYRSEEERLWFQTNCTGAVTPNGAPAVRPRAA